MALRQITLEWQPLRPLATTPTSDISNRTGVYTWGFDLADERDQRLSDVTEPPEEYLRSLDWQFIPYYVGKASDLRQRLTGHATGIRDDWTEASGYWYFHRDALHNFMRYQNPDLTSSVDLKNWRVFPNTPATHQQYVDSTVREQLREHSAFMLDRTWFSYAELEDPNDRRPVESLLHDKLDGYVHKDTKGSYAGIEVIHDGDPTICKAFDYLMKLSAANKNREPSWS
jgi:hypothetical protein